MMDRRVSRGSKPHDLNAHKMSGFSADMMAEPNARKGSATQNPRHELVPLEDDYSVGEMFDY